MIKTEFTDLNYLIAIIDSCQVDMVIQLQSTWGEEDYDENKNIKVRMVKPFLDDNRDFIVSQSKKKEFISILAEYFDDWDYYHYNIKNKDKLIGIGYDHCVINFLHPDFFKLSEEHRQLLEECDINFTKELEEK